MKEDFMLSCPLPKSDAERVQLAHGGGGRLMQNLIESVFVRQFENPHLIQRHDSAVFEAPPGRLALTTDSYVVKPLFFPGGDIGSLAVNGTINDLAMAGARPLHLSAAFILEEGFLLSDLHQVVESMHRAAQAARVTIVTGDTKVVDKGKGDGLFINTTGVGVLEHGLTIAPSSVQVGDAILVSGDLGRHGIAVMAAREGLDFETTIQSDCAPLAEPISALLNAGIEIHCLRDLTRGGLASALNEIASASLAKIYVEECQIPVEEEVQAACEILGFDPLYVANEGRFVAFVPERLKEKTLSLLREFPICRNASSIGYVADLKGSVVLLKNRIGTERIMDMLSGEQLPRIC